MSLALNYPDGVIASAAVPPSDAIHTFDDAESSDAVIGQPRGTQGTG